MKQVGLTLEQKYYLFTLFISPINLYLNRYLLFATDIFAKTARALLYFLLETKYLGVSSRILQKINPIIKKGRAF